MTPRDTTPLSNIVLPPSLESDSRAISDPISCGLTDEHRRTFQEDGYLILRNVIHTDELASLQTECTFLIDEAIANTPTTPAHIGADIVNNDIVYRLAPTGETWPHRIHHIAAKSLAARSLLAHPHLLTCVHTLIAQDFIPTWETLAIKKTGSGISIPWHRDANANKLQIKESQSLLFNCDCYLDRSNVENCLWVIPGSHRWSQERVALELSNQTQDRFDDKTAVPLCLNAGDVLLRNPLIFNGSPPAFGKNQRIIHFEYRPVSLILKYNWFNEDFIDKKRAMLSRCVTSRTQQAVTATENSYPWPFTDDGDRRFRFPLEDFDWII